MDESYLQELAQRYKGRFKLTTLVQKRLSQLMREGSEVITKQSGGRPLRSVVEEVHSGRLTLTASDGGALPGTTEAEPKKPKR